MRMLRIITGTLLLAACAAQEPQEAPECPATGEGAEEASEDSPWRPSRVRLGTQCMRIRLSTEEQYVQGRDGTMTELEWLKESCWQEERFDMEYIYCMYAKGPRVPPDRPSPGKSYYPCDFSDEYIRNFGPPDEGKKDGDTQD